MIQSVWYWNLSTIWLPNSQVEGNGRVGQPDCGQIPVLNRLVHRPVDKNEMPPHLWPECQYNLTYRELEKDKKYKLIYHNQYIFDNDTICLILKFVHNLATQFASWGQRESWAARLWTNSGIKQVGSSSSWQKWNATTSLARMSIQFDMQGAKKRLKNTNYVICQI